MAVKTTKDSMGWFKLNAGMFISETAGLSDTHVAIYIKLLTIYWTSGNKLPDIDCKLKRRLGFKNEDNDLALAEILNEFFPLDAEENYFHEELDRQLLEVATYSKIQSERASRPRGARHIEESTPIVKPTSDDLDNF
jgi:uncharacterized protein YdaU (DUF1376 family)